MVFIVSILNFPLYREKFKRRRSRMGLRPPSPFGWRTLVRCPTVVFPLLLLSVEGRKALAVEQKPWRRCLLPSVEPRRGGGDFPKLKCVAGPNREQWHPPPRRRALGILVRVDGVWSAGLTGGQHGVRTLQGRTDCVAVTVLSEESTFEAGRNAFAVWPRLVAVKRLSSFRPKGQERPGLAKAAGL